MAEDFRKLKKYFAGLKEKDPRATKEELDRRQKDFIKGRAELSDKPVRSSKYKSSIDEGVTSADDFMKRIEDRRANPSRLADADDIYDAKAQKKAMQAMRQSDDVIDYTKFRPSKVDRALAEKSADTIDYKQIAREFKERNKPRSAGSFGRLKKMVGGRKGLLGMVAGPVLGALGVPESAQAALTGDILSVEDVGPREGSLEERIETEGIESLTPEEREMVMKRFRGEM